MMFKVGDKVKYINSDGYIPVNSINTITKIDNSNVPYNLGNGDWVRESSIVLAEKTWDTLEVGDIIVNTQGAKAMVIDVFPNSFVRSWWGNFNESYGIYSKKEAQKNGWRIKGAVTETVKEMTLKDVEKLVGSKVKIIK